MRCSRPHLLPAELSPKQRGFALLLVLWVLALLSVLAAGLAAESRSGDQAALTFVALARARAAADAGVTLAVATLIEPNATARWPADGQVKAVRYRDQDISVSVQDEGGKIDLNRAPEALLAGLLTQLGIDGDARDGIVAAILQRRDTFLAGATPPLRSRGRGRARMFELGDQAFATVSELRLIPGVSDEIYARIRPFVTVYTQSATVNPLTAARLTLLSVPGMTAPDADAYMATRAEAGNRTGEDDEAEPPTPTLPGGGTYFAVLPLRTATILSRATDESGISFTREAVVEVSPENPVHPYRVLQWTQQLGTEEHAEHAD